MALPTLSKTWIYNVAAVNNPLYSGNNSTYAIFDSLAWLVGMKLAMCKTTGWVDKDGNPAIQNYPWTVKVSSDGDVANTSDNWASYLSMISNATTPTAKISTTDLGWCVLQNSGLPNFEVLIGTSNAVGANIYYSRQNAWCSWLGFDVSSPSITAFPTATDSFQLVTDTYTAGVAAASSLFDSIFHIAMSTDSECTRLIGCRGNTPVLFWQFEKVKNPVLGWNSTIFCTARANATALKNQGLSADFLTTQNTVVKLDGYSSRRVYMASEGYSSAPIATSIRTAGNIDNEYKLYPAIISSDYYPTGLIGSVFDMWFSTLSAVPGRTFPGSGNRQFLSLGGVVIPWTNSRFYMNP